MCVCVVCVRVCAHVPVLVNDVVCVCVCMLSFGVCACACVCVFV